MKGIKTLVTTMSIFSLMSAGLAVANPRMATMNSDRDWRMNGHVSPLYNSSTVETVTGEVIAVERMTAMTQRSGGIHLLMETQSEEISVHLGPAWYLEEQGMQIEPGDRIEVVGSRVTIAEVPTIIATEIHQGDQVLTLRDDSGSPAWRRCWR